MSEPLPEPRSTGGPGGLASRRTFNRDARLARRVLRAKLRAAKVSGDALEAGDLERCLDLLRAGMEATDPDGNVMYPERRKAAEAIIDCHLKIIGMSDAKSGPDVQVNVQVNNLAQLVDQVGSEEDDS